MRSRSVTLWAILVLSATASGDIVNGGFESGDMTGWGGDNVELLSSLGSIAPTEGNYFACVTNGPGDTAVVGILSTSSFQTITVPEGTPILTFDWDFLTAEDTPSSSFNDYGLAGVKVPSLWIDGVRPDTKWGGFVEIGGSGVTSPAGSHFTKHLGWQTYTVDLSDYFGRAADLQFYVICDDIGAADGDSAVLIDNIYFTPEPATLLLLTFGALIIRRKK